MDFAPAEHRESPIPDTATSILQAGSRWLDLIIAAVLFVLLVAVYFSSQDTVPGADSKWSVHIAMSIIKEGNTDLDEYAEVIGQDSSYRIRHVDGHLQSFYPLGAPLMAVPFVFAADVLAEQVHSLDLYHHLQTTYDSLVQRIELLVASVISALFCVVVYFMGRIFLGRWQSLILVFLAAFCTSVWSTASRGLWQHGPGILMLSTALFLILAAEKKPWLAQFASIPLAFSWVVRPTNSISIALFSVYVLIRFRKYFAQYLLWATLIAVPALALNISVYGSVLPAYYQPGRVGLSGALFEALIGNLISPARGLLIYSSIFLFVMYGIILKVKNSEFRMLDAFLLGILGLHWLAISASLEGWWGGHSYGPRLFSDMIPYLLYFLIPTIRQLALPMTARRVPLAVLFVLFAALSFFMHFRGATELTAVHWNASLGWNEQGGYLVEDINRDQARLWDWTDPPFLRGLRPAILHVLPQGLSVLVEEGETQAQASTMVVGNAGDEDLVWQVTTPYRARISSASGPKEGESFDQQAVSLLTPGARTPTLTVTIEVDGYEPGIHSLGAILVSAQSSSHKQVRHSPIAIPISLEVLPAQNETDGRVPGQGAHQVFLPLLSREYVESVLLAAPPDILVNGAAQTLTEDRIQAFYGAGWYDVEHLGAYSWRWAKSPAEIYIYSPSRRRIELESTPVNLLQPGVAQGKVDSATLRVTTNHGDSVKVVVQRDQSFSLFLELEPGWNLTTIASEAGNIRPVDLDPGSGDARLLSFSLDAVNLIEE